MLIGITGGIGMGKTTVLRDFSRLGGSVADADEVAHSLYVPGGQAYDAMVDHWGEGILEGSGKVDRARVGERVFRNAEELAWLNGLLHPLIKSELHRLERQTPGPLYCAVPLLYECGWEQEVEAVIAVWCEPEVQRQRLLARGWSAADIARRLASQLSADEKLRRADYGILSHCSWDELHEQCRVIHDSIVEASSDRARTRR